MKINELLQDVFRLQIEINKLLKDSSYIDYDDFTGKYEYPKTADEFFIHSHLKDIFEELEKINSALEYLKKPIKTTGYLVKNESGRFECNNGDYYTSGSSIEFKYYDDIDECYKWIFSWVESSDGEYYIVGYRNLEMLGLEVRQR